MEVEVSIKLLITSVTTLFCFIIPGFILRKCKIAGDGFAKALSLYVLYIAQVAMLVHGFITAFDATVFGGLCQLFVCGFVAHGLFYLLAVSLFKKAPEAMRKVLRFGIVFSNAGYIGIPVISDVFGEAFAIYATIYVVWFNIFAFSLGRLIYTGDTKYVSLKEAIINPAVIPITIGLIIYLTGLGGWIRNVAATDTLGGQALSILYNVLTVLKNTVAPASMVVIGVRLADVSFKGMFKDKYMYPFVAMRLLICPALMWCFMKLVSFTGLLYPEVIAVVLILASTPSAAVTTMFAELYDGDGAYAGKMVAVTTILSVVTMPVMALLLKL